MEETIGYEALFEPEEWDSMNLVYAWDNEPDDWGSPEEGGSRKHSVSVVAVHDGYELTCDSCDLFDHLSDVTDADNLKRLHEAFVATLVENWSVDR